MSSDPCNDCLFSLRAGSPVRRPDWRIRRARRLHRRRQSKLGVPRRIVGDDLVIQLLVLCHGWEWVPPRPEELPAIEAALRWHATASPHARFAVETRLLAGESDAVIADHVGLPPDVIRFHELLHFHCRDRLHVRSFIMNTFLETGNLTPSRAVVLRRVAYFRGMAFLGEILDALADPRPIPKCESATLAEWEAAIDRAERRRWFALQQLSPISPITSEKQPALLKSVEGWRPQYRYARDSVTIPIMIGPAKEPILRNPAVADTAPARSTMGDSQAA